METSFGLLFKSFWIYLLCDRVRFKNNTGISHNVAASFEKAQRATPAPKGERKTTVNSTDEVSQKGENVDEVNACGERSYDNQSHGNDQDAPDDVKDAEDEGSDCVIQNETEVRL